MPHRCKHRSITCNWLANVYSKFQSSKVPWEARKESVNLVGVVQILSQWLHCSPLPETQAQGQSMMPKILLIMMGLVSVQEPFLHHLQSRAPCCAPSNSLMIALTMTCSWTSPATLRHSQRLNSSIIHGIRNRSAEIIPLQRAQFLLMEKKASPTSQLLVSGPKSLDTGSRIVLIYTSLILLWARSGKREKKKLVGLYWYSSCVFFQYGGCCSLVSSIYSWKLTVFFGTGVWSRFWCNYWLPSLYRMAGVVMHSSICKKESLLEVKECLMLVKT